jgi:hypothetical protein
MKCKIIAFNLSNGQEAADKINELLKEVDKIISVTQSQAGQGSVMLTIIYHEHKA